MASVELRGVTKVFSDRRRETVRALDGVSFEVADGELVAIVGPSGSGKTTLLRLIAGLESESEGIIRLDGIAADGAKPHERDVAMVFQDHALLPHLTVSENVGLGLKLRRISAKEIERQIAAVAETVGIKRFLPRLPQELSGGERQRVALARAIVRRPKVFLFDEPLSNLDAPTRWQLRALIARLHRELRATMIYVTHDQHEAMALGQRIVVLRDGALQQVADPMTLYGSPANAFVASFIGSPPMNLFRGHVAQRGGDFVFTEHNEAGAANGSRAEVILDRQRDSRVAESAEENILLGIRAEHISIGTDARCHVNAWIELVEFLGAETVLHCSTGATQFRVRAVGGPSYRSGQRVPLWFDLANAVYFNPVSEKVID